MSPIHSYALESHAKKRSLPSLRMVQYRTILCVRVELGDVTPTQQLHVNSLSRCLVCMSRTYTIPTILVSLLRSHFASPLPVPVDYHIGLVVGHISIISSHPSGTLAWYRYRHPQNYEINASIPRKYHCTIATNLNCGVVVSLESH